MLRPDIKAVEGSDEVLDFAIEWAQRASPREDNAHLDTIAWFNAICRDFHQFCEDRQIRIETLWAKERERQRFIMHGGSLGKNFWFKFEWDAWRNDHQLRRCSKAAKGFWIDCIAAMEDQQTYFLSGTVDDICRDTLSTRPEFDEGVSELLRTGAANVTFYDEEGNCAAVLNARDVQKFQGRVLILSRRLSRKYNLTEYNRLKKRESRGQETVNEMSGTSSSDPSKIEIRSKSLESINNSEEAHNPVRAGAEKTSSPKAPPDEDDTPKILLPKNFRPPDEMWAWAKRNCRSLNLVEELQEFITFWRDIASKYDRRTIRGWNLSWKKRMTDRQKELEEEQNGKQPQFTDRRQRAIDDRNALEQIRRDVAESDQRKLLEQDAPDRQRLIGSGLPNSDTP